MSWWVLEIVAKVEAGEDVPQRYINTAYSEALGWREALEDMEIAKLRGVPYSPGLMAPEGDPPGTLEEARRAEQTLGRLAYQAPPLQERKFQRPKMTLLDPTDPISRRPGPKLDPRITAAADDARAAIAKGVPEKRALMDAALAHGVRPESVRTRLRRDGQSVNSN
jgi:hypothetical protein